MIDVLPKADITGLQKSLFELSQAREIAEAMQRCQLDADEHLSRCQHYQGMIEALIREFGAGASPKGRT